MQRMTSLLAPCCKQSVLKIKIKKVNEDEEEVDDDDYDAYFASAV